MNENKKLIPTIVIVLVAVVFGSTSAYAEKAIPGDPLYTMKLNVNEKVAGIFSVTKEEKAEYLNEVEKTHKVEGLNSALSLIADSGYKALNLQNCI